MADTPKFDIGDHVEARVGINTVEGKIVGVEDGGALPKAYGFPKGFLYTIRTKDNKPFRVPESRVKAL